MLKKSIVKCVITVCVLLLAGISMAFKKDKGKLLIFSKTNGFHHESIAAGIEAIKKLGTENNFDVDATVDSLEINDANLKQYKAILFLSPTGNILGKNEELALQNFVHRGGGVAGVHAATDCEYQWPWFGKMMGAYFTSHPRQQTAKLQVVDKKHPSTKMLPDTWERKDEWYNFKDINPDLHILIKIDESSYEGGKNNGDHPMAWYHKFEGGKVFYTALGHTNEAYSEPLFLEHLLGGIQYVMK